MKETLIIILLVIIVTQLHLVLRRFLKIINLLNYFKSGLFGYGRKDGIMSKLNYLEYIQSKLDRIFKEPKIKYPSLDNKEDKI